MPQQLQSQWRPLLSQRLQWRPSLPRSQRPASSATTPTTGPRFTQRETPSPRIAFVMWAVTTLVASGTRLPLTKRTSAVLANVALLVTPLPSAAFLSRAALVPVHPRPHVASNVALLGTPLFSAALLSRAALVPVHPRPLVASVLGIFRRRRSLCFLY